MQKILPHLWYDKEAKEAAALYTSVFPNSKITHTSTIHNTPSGDADILSITLDGLEFMLINAGPYFKFNPSISFAVACSSKEEVDAFWEKLAAGGEVLMEKGEYPFADWYGWTTDKYGLSWQIMYRKDSPVTPRITPTMMFVGEVVGKAKEALELYTSVFHDAHIDYTQPYEEGDDPDAPGTLKYAAFTLEGQQFAAMDSAMDHKFQFTEALSFLIRCENQDEIDYYWEKLSAVPEAEQCGWLKDKYGFSWQVHPTLIEKYLEEGTADQQERVTQAFLAMKKFDLAQLTEAFEGK